MRLHKAFLSILVLAGFAPAELVDSAANGFTVKTVLTIQSPPDDVYRRLVRNVGDWWNPAHTLSGNASNLRIEEQPAGCFCEKLPNNGVARHMEVVFVAPGKGLILRGALGPMQPLAVTGSMQIQLTAVETGTRLEVTYAVGGYLSKGLNTWAAAVDMVLAEQFTRLKSLIETGQPASK